MVLPFPRIFHRNLVIALGVLIAVISHQALAETLEERVARLEGRQEQQSDVNQMLTRLVERVNVSGFLSIRGGQIDDESVTYLNALDDTWTFSEESVAGLQVDTTLSDVLSVSLQMKARSGESSLELEWAYLEYAWQPDLKVRAGRLRAPGFMLSEFLDVGYAYPWTLVPFEVYGWLPFSSYEGIDLRYWASMGDLDFRFNPYVGTSTGQQLGLGNIDYSDQSSEFAGVDFQVNYDIFTVRAGYSRYKLDLENSVLDNFVNTAVNGLTLVPDFGSYITGVEIPGLVDYVEDVMVNGVLADAITGIQSIPDWELDPALAGQVALLQSEQASLLAQLSAFQNIPAMNGNVDGEFYGVGFSADNGKFLLMSEFASSSIEGAFPDVDSGYIMFGYRFGNWMPHFTFAKMYTTDDDGRPDLGELQLNPLIWSADPGLNAVATGASAYSKVLTAAVDIIRLEQETFTLGLRWDPATGVAIKADLFHVQLKNNSYGFALPSAMLKLAETDFITASNSGTLHVDPPPDAVNGVRLALDIVF